MGSPLTIGVDLLGLCHDGRLGKLGDLGDGHVGRRMRGSATAGESCKKMIYISSYVEVADHISRRERDLCQGRRVARERNQDVRDDRACGDKDKLRSRDGK